MNEGKKFEEDFKKSFPENYFIYRLRDSGSSFNGKQDGLRFTITNACDFIAFDPENGLLLPLELKSVQGNSLPFTNIKEHQLKELNDFSTKLNVFPFIVINFRGSNKTFFMYIKNLMNFIETTNKKSINIKDVQEFGGIDAEQYIKKVRSGYKLEIFFNKLKEMKGEI